jgi:hypothetical protein
VEEGTRVRVTGTATFFIKDRLLVSAQPPESFVHVIEEEMEERCCWGSSC